MLPSLVKFATFVSCCALAMQCFAGSPRDTAGSDAAAPNAWDDPATHDTLDAMTNASTWYHPDLFGLTVGMRRYGHRQFAAALHYFEIGAQSADKLSQLSIGLMYLNGEGVAKDPVEAYAWLSIAAERDYPEFLATRDRVKATLSKAQLLQAETLRARLAERYGDDVAKRRMAVQLRLGTLQPHEGYSYAPWEPQRYFASRDAEWKGKGKVKVGPIESPPSEAKSGMQQPEKP
ncbi:MAG TPA: sel1 repeat family protein [Rudaea sp.]|jgi:TPR repeat protein